MTEAPPYPGAYWFRLLPVTMVMGSIFFLSHQSGSSLFLPNIVHIDKVVHSLVYMTLGLTALFALPRPWLQRPLLSSGAVVLFCLFYGITDELHQSFIPGRSCDVLDVVADGSGGILAVVCGWGWRRWRVTVRG